MSETAGPFVDHDLRYEVGETLGRGGMGEVRRCTDHRTGRDVALKTIRPGAGGDDVDRRFLREARVQAQLEHPNIVPVYDVGRTPEGRPFFTMKRVEGSTLEAVLGRLRDRDAATEEAFSLHRLLSAFSQVCLALDFAHARGVVHRDLKPANVIFGPFGEVYVLDWGLVRVHEGAEEGLSVSLPRSAYESRIGRAVGTPGYMAPEQASAGVVDARSDIFALGAMLFEILTLEPLLGEAQILAAARGSPLVVDAVARFRQVRRDVPPELELVCDRATAMAPDDRYDTARDLHDAIEQFLGGQRDVVLRRRQSAENLAAARRIMTDASSPRARVAALREVGRALALSPDDRDARELFMALLAELPSRTPPHVEEELAANALKRLRSTAKSGVVLYTLPWLTLYPVVVILSGLRDPVAALVPPVFWCLAGLTVHLFRRQTHGTPWWPVVMVMLAVASTSLLLGPLFILPVLAPAIAAAHVLGAPRFRRTRNLVLGCLALIVPTVLAYAGIHPIYTFSGDALSIRGALYGTPTHRYLGLGVVHVAALFIGIRFGAVFRKLLDQGRTQSVLFNWHLSRLFGRPAADPAPSSDGFVSSGVRPRQDWSDRTSERPGDDAEAEGRYVTLDKLGEGGMGEVLLCEDRRTGRNVAMKVMRRELDPEGPLGVRFVREARVQARLEHPAIVPVYDVGTEPDGAPFFTMKAVKGTTLADVLLRLMRGEPEAVRAWPRHQLLAVFEKVCLAVDFAHTRGVLHRDLKPANVMLGDHGEVYVLDWGVAKLDDQLRPSWSGPREGGGLETQAGDRLGTPGYMAPEQASGRVDEVDPRTDVFALGAILFAILAREPFLDMGDARALLRGVPVDVESRPSRRSPAASIPPELDAICARATAMDRDARYPSARALYEAVEAFLASDRELSLRERLLTTVIAAAEETTRLALEPGAPLVARERALGEIGRALALAPDDQRPIELFLTLLGQPPAETPTEVREEVLAQTMAMSKRAAPIAAAIFIGLWTTVYPLSLYTNGVKNPAIALVVALAWIAAGAAVLLQYVGKKPATVPYPPAIAMLAVALTSFVTGPLLFVPSLATVIGMGNVLGGRSDWRRWVALFGSLAIVVPTVLAWSGIHPVYELTGETMVLHSSVFLDASLLYVWLPFGHLFAVVFACGYAARLRKAIDEIDRRNLLHAWQLSSLVTPSAASDSAADAPRDLVALRE